MAMTVPFTFWMVNLPYAELLDIESDLSENCHIPFMVTKS